MFITTFFLFQLCRCKLKLTLLLWKGDSLGRFTTMHILVPVRWPRRFWSESSRLPAWN